MNKTELNFGLIADNSVNSISKLINLIVNKASKKQLNYDYQYPKFVVLQNTPKSNCTSEELEQFYIAELEKLKSLGCTNIVAPNLKVNKTINNLTHKNSLKCIDILEEVGSSLYHNYPNAKKIGIIASKEDIANNNFSNILQKYTHSIDIIYPGASY